MYPTYDYRKIITLGDTNALGNVYFAEYFVMQGATREQWVRECVPDGLDHLRRGLVLSTKSAHCEYRKPFYPFDITLCRMHFENLRRVSVKLVFEVFEESSAVLHAHGWQVVVFKDAHRKTCEMPTSFRDAARELLWPASKTRPYPEAAV